MKILAISGSIRKNSYNTALLENLSTMCGAEMEIELFPELGGIPPFNPDIPEEKFDPSVLNFRKSIEQAAAVIISTPEYAHGIPGAVKNALDWVVSSSEIVLKPVAVMSVSTSQLGGFRSVASLITVLTAMNTNVVIDASVCVPFAKAKFDQDGVIADSLLRRRLVNSLEILAERAGSPV